jgi:hypothetical protein
MSALGQFKWSPEDSTAFREFLRRVPREKIVSVMQTMCPAIVDTDTILKNGADAVARVAAMRAGWDEYESRLFALAEPKKQDPSDSGYRDMT